MTAKTAKTYEIISETSDGRLVAVCANEANSAREARAATSNFCAMMGITVHSVIESTRWAALVKSQAAPDCQEGA